MAQSFALTNILKFRLQLHVYFNIGEFGYLEDQQDNDEPTSHLNDQNSIYTAQVKELRSRLEKARTEGQEVGEKRSLGEISALRTQLGTKSR